ncbi:hypothetical protein GWD52_07400 [Enterobacteriaceae bacterium 4M9]|nr:hypothetical protein [Enterobacteriaceae bacterium 4M9]
MKTSCLLSISLTIIALAFFSYLYQTGLHKLNIGCTANFIHISESEKYAMMTVIKQEFRPNETVTVIMDGKIQLGDNTYTLKRRIHGQYRHEEKNVYRLMQSKIYLAGSDSVPPDVFRKYFFNLNPQQDMFFTISRLENQWIMGTPYTPAFICEN